MKKRAMKAGLAEAKPIVDAALLADVRDIIDMARADR